MTKPEKIDDLDDVKIWIADHNGRIDAFWAAQHSWNQTIEGRMSSVEKRVMWLAGVASALGAALGAAVSVLIGH